MKLRSLLLSSLLIPTVSLATTITRVNKPNGTKDWIDGFANDLTAASLNGDINAIINVVNGNLDNNNIASGANISWSKIITTGQVVDATVSGTAAIETTKLDGYSDNATETKDTLDSSASTLPATMQQELRAIRYAIQTLNGAGTQNAGALDMEWYLDPARTDFNLLYNGDFEDSVDGNLATAPSGWSLSDCSTITNCDTDDTDTSEGIGHELTITSDNDSNDDGVTQAIASLKASKQYLAIARAKAASGGTCQLITTGAGTDANATTTSTSYVTLADIFTVSAGAATVTLALTVNDDVSGGDVCSFDHVGVFEINADAIPKLSYLPVYESSSSVAAISDSYPGTSLISATVNVPGHGYIIKVLGDVCMSASDANQQEIDVQSKVTQSVNGAAATTVIERGFAYQMTGVDLNRGTVSLMLPYVIENPTVGAYYTFGIESNDNGSGTNVEDFSYGGGNCGSTTASLLVELVKVK
jgi:hypothetical protein